MFWPNAMVCELLVSERKNSKNQCILRIFSMRNANPASPMPMPNMMKAPVISLIFIFTADALVWAAFTSEIEQGLRDKLAARLSA